MINLTNRVALVTGAGRGIGREIALEYGKLGADLVLVSRTKTEIERVSKACIDRFNVKSIAIEADISIEDEVFKVFRGLKDNFSKIDILVNNASIYLKKDILNISVKEWDDIISVNLRGMFLCCREALRIMIPRNYGKIINISSESGTKGFALESAYNTSKFGQLGLTKSLANELKGYNININAILPSATNTKLFREAYPEVDTQNILQPSDIAKIAVFLASDYSKVLKGVSIEAYNGQDFEPALNKK